MNPLELYEAYSAVYAQNEVSVEEDFAFIDELSDNELDQVMEEILSEGVELSECVEAFDEVLTEARVDMSARAAARKQYMQQSEKSAKEARGRAAAKERTEKRAERVQRIKSSAKRAAEKVKTTAAGVASAAAGGASEAGRRVRAGAEKVGGKLAAAKDRIKGFLGKVGRAAKAGYSAAKKEFRGESGKTEVGKEVKDAAKKTISSIDRRKAAKAKAKAYAAGGRGTGVMQGQPAGTFKSKKSRAEAQKREARLTASESYETLASYILEDLINEGYAETFEEAFKVLESFSDYEVGELAENYLVEETVDLYDVVLEHLLDEGFADTEEAATVIMANMSEEWRDEIIESRGGYADSPVIKSNPSFHELTRGKKRPKGVKATSDQLGKFIRGNIK
jgi:hypothetical protein